MNLLACHAGEPEWIWIQTKLAVSNMPIADV
jgi:hypothetical protein